MRKLEIDFVIETSLAAIFAKDIFSRSIYLKGGQALRIKENLKNRFSADMDFSSSGSVSNEEAFFEMMLSALSVEFFRLGFYLFDFKYLRRPKFKEDGVPDFWSGWGVEFKLVEESKRNEPIEKIRREALIPMGTQSPKITIDISEYEYCGSVDKVKVKGVDVNVYSRSLLLLEKIRAICQQHPDYPYKDVHQRSRDYYDIESLWSKVLKEGDPELFLNDCAKHIKNVFKAKGVSLDILEKIFVSDFVEVQKSGWGAVEQTVTGKIQSFDYYNESLSRLVSDIRGRIAE